MFKPPVLFFLLACVSTYGGFALSQRTPQTKTSSHLPHNPSSFRVVAYLPDYRLKTLTGAQLNGITDLIYFSIAPLPSGALDLQRCPPGTLQKVRALADETSTGKSLRLSIAVGGWARGAGFAPLVANVGARQRFVQTLTTFCLDNKLAGADFDWEGPQNAQEEAGYGTLLQEVKQSFAPRHLRLTVAQAAWEKLGRDGLDAVDEIHVMAYDHDGPHSTFAQAQEDIAAFVKKGVPKRKLLLGMPFYGRSIRDRKQEMTYADVVRQYHPAPDVDRAGNIYFNNIGTIQHKTRYALDAGLGGVMIWELGQDTTDSLSLTNAISQTIHRR